MDARGGFFFLVFLRVQEGGTFNRWKAVNRQRRLFLQVYPTQQNQYTFVENIKSV